jgi:EAL domain-containing protein (putative c-di-GMP-specific phosphodiesterase class I)
MGQGLGLEVIAEGVENTRQLAMLTGQDCALAQGFYFSPPLAEDDCANWLARNADLPVKTVPPGC